jgi:hypothetical protein
MKSSNIKRSLFGIIPILFISFTLGCQALLVGGAAVGAGTGTYLFVNGELKTDYPYPFEKVWTACERTVADMRGTAVEPVKEISQGTISTKINNEMVKFTVTFKDKNLTTVGIRVGIIGDEKASKLLHGKIKDNISQW